MRSRITSSFGPRFLRYSITWTGRHVHRSRRHSLAYWLFGIWLIEASIWACVGGAIAAVYVTWWMVRVLGWLAVAFGVAFSALANWWFDRRAERKAHRDLGRNV